MKQNMQFFAVFLCFIDQNSNKKGTNAEKSKLWFSFYLPHNGSSFVTHGFQNYSLSSAATGSSNSCYCAESEMNMDDDSATQLNERARQSKIHRRCSFLSKKYIQHIKIKKKEKKKQA